MLIGLIWLMVFQLAAVGSQAPPRCIGWRSLVRELCDRVRLHDHRFVAHHALALTQTGLAGASNEFISRSIHYSISNHVPHNHTRVIYPTVDSVCG